MAPAISRALGIAGQPARPVLETLLDALAPQDILIVLDNCEHLIGACAKIADAIVSRCPRVHLLATSREPLGIGGETIYRVPSLSLPGPGEAPRPSPPTRSRCSWTGPGHMASAFDVDEQTAPWRCRSAGGWTGCRWPSSWPPPGCARCRLGSLHDRLDQRFRLLTGGSRTALPRQQTLRGDGRLVLFAAHRHRAAAAAAPVGVRRELRSGRRRRRVRLRRHRSVRRHRPARLAGGQEPGRGRADRGEPCATGCWRPSASSPPNGSSRSAKTRPPRSERPTARTSCPWPRRPPPT